MKKGNEVMEIKEVAENATSKEVVAKKPKTMADWVNEREVQLKDALPKHIDHKRFLRVALTALNNNITLRQCTPTSFLGALMTSAQLGLEPNTPLGYAYLIPRNLKNKANGKYEMNTTFQIGYKGLLLLAYNSGKVETISATAVKQNDDFSYSLGLKPDLVHKPALENRGESILFYAIIKMKDGGVLFDVMSREEVDVIRKAADSAKSTSPWDSHYDEMAKKTVLKKALKYAPLSSEVSMAIDVDEGIIHGDEADLSLNKVSFDYNMEQPQAENPLALEDEFTDIEGEIEDEPKTNE